MSVDAPANTPAANTETEPLLPLWSILLMAALLLLCGGVIALRMADFRRQGPTRPPPTVSLEPLTVPAELLVQAAAPHAIPQWSDPETVTTGQARLIRIGRRGKFLVSTDLVLGVELEGKACAYPVRFLEWCEVLDHTLGGVPITVTWSPLTGSASVFDRRALDAKGEAVAEPRAFAASGKLLNHNLVLRDAEGSLWSQLLGRAISGPAAAQKLTLRRLPVSVVSWQAWKSAQPDTLVINPPKTWHQLLKRRPYGNYMGSDLIRPEYPLEPKPPAALGLPNKAPVLAVRVAADQPWRVYRIDALAERGAVTTTQDGVELVFTAQAQPLTATVSAEGGRPIESVRSFWFGWHAAFPKARLE